MRVILISCFIYLLGVVVLLYFKPSLMFDKEGMWKEFALTLNERYTWFPFWLFCILWAIISYSIVSFFFEQKSESCDPVGKTMKPGYYVLDKNASKKEGFPKYIYLGPENPEE
jgi:hypothetical protein